MSRYAPWKQAATGLPAAPKKPRRSIKAVSIGMSARRRKYLAARKEFLANNPWCEWHELTKAGAQRAKEVHHMRGRRGTLLLDQRYWLPVSAEGHRWIHDHPDEARKLGLLCAVGDWGRQEP